MMVEKEGDLGGEDIIQRENFYGKESKDSTLDESKVRRRTVKGAIDCSDLKRLINYAVHP
jgi:hypothetical protein